MSRWLITNFQFIINCSRLTINSQATQPLSIYPPAVASLSHLTSFPARAFPFVSSARARASFTPVTSTHPAPSHHVPLHTVHLPSPHSVSLFATSSHACVRSSMLSLIFLAHVATFPSPALLFSSRSHFPHPHLIDLHPPHLVLHRRRFSSMSIGVIDNKHHNIKTAAICCPSCRPSAALSQQTQRLAVLSQHQPWHSAPRARAPRMPGRTTRSETIIG